jgi:hypothetical protein
MIVRHLLQMNDSARGNNFVKGGPSIRQLALRPNLQRTAVLLPNHVAYHKMNWPGIAWRVTAAHAEIVSPTGVLLQV